MTSQQHDWLARRGSWVAAWLLIVSVTVTVPLGVAAEAASHGGLARLVRSFDLDDLGLSEPAGVAFSGLSGSFFITEGSPDRSGFSVTEVTSDEVRKGSARIDALVRDPVNVAFDEAFGRLLVYADPAGHLVEVAVDESGVLDPRSVKRHNVREWDVGEAAGLAVDPESGVLFILDVSDSRIVQVVPDLDGTFDDAVVEEVDLRQTGIADPVSIAYDRSTGHVFVASSSRPVVHEVSGTGTLLATWDVSEAELASPGGMVVAESGDLTDDPAQMSLYIADRGESDSVEGGTGQFVEVSLVAAPAVSSSTSFTASLVNEIEAFKWSPPSPDTSGVAYLPATNTLMASDGEVNEMPIYAGANMFQATLGGSLTDTFTTLDFGNNEPTGVSVNPSNNHLFISRDTPPKEVFEMDPGADGEYSTADDTITSFVTADFGAVDPEGVAYAPGLGHLFIADGLNNEIYELSPGSNGVFDGVKPAGDDVVVGTFDTFVHGMEDPEGVVYNPDTATLYIAGKTRNIGTHNFDTLLETTTSGALLQTIDVSAVNPGRQYPRQKLSGLAYGPSSQNPNAMSIYIADRGEDNNNDPNENDGRIYEVTAPSGGGGSESAPTANGDSAVTAQDTAVTVDVAGNDSDPDGNLDPATAVTVSGPSNGATLDNGDGTITYTPNLGFTGSDSFTYEICDTTGLCDTAVVDVTVTVANDPPVAVGDSATTSEDAAVTVDVAGNDSDPDGNLVVGSASTVAGPSDGVTLDNGDGTITYTPNQDFNGSDSFTYEICDDLGLCDSALVSVTVDPVADPPVAADDGASTAANTAVIVDVAANDSDVDGDLDLSSVATVSGPSNGGTSDNGDGTITYTPALDFTGSDSFVYEICDGTAPVPQCDQATVSVAVSGDQVIHVTSTSGGSVGGVSFRDEDIVAFDTGTGTWSMFFDGSDVGLGASGQEIDGFHIDTDGSILISLGAAVTLPNVGAVDDHDVVRFAPTSRGDTTAGSYTMYFNGEDHGLTASGEDIDSVGLAPDGRLVVSLRGSYSVPGVSGGDVDLLAFDNGTWSLYLDGVAVGLDGGNTEDVTAAWIDTNGDVYLSVRSSFTVPGLSGDSADIFTCTPNTPEPITDCTFTMFWDGSDSAHGYGSESINGMHISG